MKILTILTVMVVSFVLGVFRGERRVVQVKKAVNSKIKELKVNNDSKLKTALKLQEKETQVCTDSYDKLVEEANAKISNLENDILSCEDRLREKEDLLMDREEDLSDKEGYENEQ